MLRRTSLKFVNDTLSKNTNWKILDIGCGYRANKNANTLADTQDLAHFYKGRNFIKLNEKKLPFKDKEFDFVISSHVLEHVKDFEFFIKELERISTKGYIELPSRLSDNLVFENKNDHLWWMTFDDVLNQINVSKRYQLVEPFLNVSTGKIFEDQFRDSLVLELFWEEKINYKIVDQTQYETFKEISFFKLIKKYISKKIRSVFKKN